MKDEDAQTVAVIYCRVSSKKQVREGHGLKSQETRAREYAANLGYQVAGVFTDDITGVVSERQGMQSMLAFLRKNRRLGIVVLIDDISRLGRHRRAYWDLRDTIAAAGGELQSPSIKFGADADSSLVEGLMVEVAQHARHKNAETTKSRMRARVQGGGGCSKRRSGIATKSFAAVARSWSQMTPLLRSYVKLWKTSHQAFCQRRRMCSADCKTIPSSRKTPPVSFGTIASAASCGSPCMRAMLKPLNGVSLGGAAITKL